MKKRFIYILGCLGALAACNALDDSEIGSIVEFAADRQEVVVSDGGGFATLKVFSSGSVTVSVEGGTPEWLELSGTKFSGDGEVSITVSPNGGYIRMAVLNLSLNGGERSLSVPVKQEGLPQYLSCTSPFSVVDGRTDTITDFILATNIPAESISCTAEYLGLYKGWIGEMSVTDGGFSVTTLANATDVCRRAKCVLSYTDGWGRNASLELFITQTDRDGQPGKRTGITLIKALGTAEGTLVGDDFLLEGIVVSDCTSPNMALNPAVMNTGSSVMADTTFARRVAYLEAEDGSWGMRLVFESEADNTLRFGTKTALNLYGATVTREEGPQRYTISGLSGWNICSSEEGAAVPEKLLSVSELTEDDLYTYITLENMEFAFKKGTYADVMEDFAIKSTVNASSAAKSSQLDGWASLLVDSEGSAIYAPVNMLCPWRRSGNGVPQGAGKVRGILVSEDMLRLGNAGKWQIRVIDESGFGMEGSSKLNEYAYWINSYNNRNAYSAINSRYVYNKLETVIPSNDLPESGASTARAEMVSENTVIPASRTDDPYTNANCYNRLTADNNGVSSDYVGIGDITTARDWFRWTEDGEFDGYNGFVFSFATSGVSASQWEFAFEFAGGYNSAATARSWPAHWCVECSTDGGASWTLVPAAVTGEDYVHMRGLPWESGFLNGQWYQTPARAGMGFSQHSFTLPSEVLNKDEVLLKLRPYDRSIVSLPLQWEDDIEASTIDSTTDVDIRIRFGFIYLRYR